MTVKVRQAKDHHNTTRIVVSCNAAYMYSSLSSNQTVSILLTSLDLSVLLIVLICLVTWGVFSYYFVSIRPIISIAAVVLLYSCLWTVTACIVQVYVSFRAIVRALCALLSCSTALFYCELLSITSLFGANKWWWWFTFVTINPRV